MTDPSATNVGGLIDACDRALARLRDATLPHGVSPRLISDIEAVRADAQRQVNLGGLAPRVLIVEDDPALRLVCRVNLELAGFDVSEAADGEAALLAALPTLIA